MRNVGGSQLHPDIAKLDFYGTELYTGKTGYGAVDPRLTFWLKLAANSPLS